MNTALKITKVGNSAAIILPKDVLLHLRSGIGDKISLTRTVDGVVLSRSDENFDAQMTVAREVMARRRRALAELAK